MNYTRIFLFIILISISLKAQWIELDSVTEFDNRNLFFVNDSLGFILVDSPPKLLKTINGGANWHEYILQGWYTSLYFINENIGFMTEGLGIQKTKDGGHSWTRNSDFSNFVSIHFVNDRIGFSAGFGRIIKTIDQGETWNIVFDGYNFRNVFATDSLTIYAFGYLAWDNYGFKSTDGGNTWQSLNMGYNTRFIYSYFINSNTGFVIGWDLGTGILLKTSNGGNSWELMLQSQTSLSSIYFTDVNTGNLVGGYSPGGSQPLLWKTTDGGLTWTDQNPESNVSDAIYSIQFVNNCVGYAIGENGLILKTINAGDSSLCNEIPPIPPPSEFKLNQNYPNPFNYYTTIKYDLPVDSKIKLTVYNILGQKVVTLVNKRQSADNYTTTWNGLNSSGQKVASGIYIYQLRIEDKVFQKKMLLLR